MRLGLVVLLVASLPGCTGVTAPVSPPAAASAAAASETAEASIPHIAPTPKPTPSAMPSANPPVTPSTTPTAIPSTAPSMPTPHPPTADGLSVDWQAADLELAGLDRAFVREVLGLPGGGYLASGHGESDTLPDGAGDGLLWRSDDGRVWERTTMTGPGGLGPSDSGPLGIVMIGGDGTWWSRDGIDWRPGDFVLGRPRELYDVAVGAEAAVVVGSAGQWASSDGVHWEPVSGDRTRESRLLAVERTRDGFIAVGEEWRVDGTTLHDIEARVWRISPDGRDWRLDRGGDLTGPSYDALAYVWAVGDTALAIGTHGTADTYDECNRLFGGDCGTQWGVHTVHRSVDGGPWQLEYAVEPQDGRRPRLDLARGGAWIQPWRRGLVAIAKDGDSPLALHFSADGLIWERSRPRDQFPEDMGYGSISTFLVDGDMAIVSGTVEPRDDPYTQDFFLQVGTITP